MMVAWSCDGHIERYHRKCRQTMLYFDDTKTTQAELEDMLQIKCKRCHKLLGLDAPSVVD